MTVRKVTLLSFITLVVALSATLLRAQSGAEQQNTEQMTAPDNTLGSARWRRRAEQLEGSWLVTVTIARPGAPPPFRVYMTFARGGAFLGTDTRRPFQTGHGAWEYLGGNEFASTSLEDLFDATGNFAGTFKGRARITVTGPNSFVAVSNAEQRNAAGEIIVQGCSTMRAERITVEPLAPQCQSITPPQ